MHNVNGALSVPQLTQEIGTLDIDEIKKAVIPDDISKARDGFYVSPSQPAIVWISPIEILDSLGEPATFEMVSTITSSIIDAYAQDEIEIVVIGND
jgi:hypothetical protein